MQQSPRDRLGTGGSHEVKEHLYFYGVNWNSLLRQKAEFVPQLVNDEDTSYFDSMYIIYSMYMHTYNWKEITCDRFKLGFLESIFLNLI